MADAREIVERAGLPERGGREAVTNGPARSAFHDALSPLARKVIDLLRTCGQSGWDSYGANALTEGAVAGTARNLAEHVFPSVCGGLAFEWDTTDVGAQGRGGLIVEFDAEGRLVGFYACNGHGDTEWEAEHSGSNQEPTP